MGGEAVSAKQLAPAGHDGPLDEKLDRISIHLPFVRHRVRSDA
jgi:hypothetical protein